MPPVKAVLVDSIMGALKAGQRGAFKFWVRGDRPVESAEGADGAVDGLNFVCPGCGEMGGLNFGPSGWTWDGNRAAPTCTPSILHDVARCGWHGYLTAGEFRRC